MTQPPTSRLMGRVAWQSPSNIAIVKYWGKKDGQLPMNPSLSMTLNRSVTQTAVDYRPKHDGENSYSFQFHQNAKESFSPKLDAFFKHVFKKYPTLGQFHFDIQSTNSFPHSAGIASSASAMSALALCIEDIANRLETPYRHFSAVEASDLARLGSGSAVRSLHANWSVWGHTEALEHSADDHAVALEKVHESFLDFHDTILIVDSSPKSVSSSAGHQLMDNHPYQQGRLQQAQRNVSLAIEAIGTGDIPLFVEICEEEALSLHALMMSSRPGFLLMKPATLQIIDHVRRFRHDTNIPVAFTLDAGPNVHLLYPNAHRQAVKQWIESVLSPFCENGQMINDHIGEGPSELDQ